MVKNKKYDDEAPDPKVQLTLLILKDDTKIELLTGQSAIATQI